MMTIQEKIGMDLKLAMIEKDDAKKSLLRVVIGEFNRVGKIVDDAKASGILKKMLDNATNVNNPNPVEAEIINTYLPSMLTSDQLTSVISSIIEDKGYSSVKDMSKIMADLKTHFPGKYDGKVASEIIKDRLK